MNAELLALQLFCNLAPIGLALCALALFGLFFFEGKSE
jgi:hypothetical protein